MSIFRRFDLHRHERSIGRHPTLRFGARFEKSIDYNRGALRRVAAAVSRRFSVNYIGAAIDCDACGVGEDDLAAVWNFFRIDSAMSRMQSRAVPGCVQAGAFTFPITSDAREHSALFGASRSRDYQESGCN